MCIVTKRLISSINERERKMADKKVKSEFEDMKNEEFEFDEAEFEDLDTSEIKRGRKKSNVHAIFFVVVALVLIGCGISLFIWNKGQDADDGVIIDEAEFDTEPNDYIQPLTSDKLAGKIDDGVTTILTFGNSPFADDGNNNLLAAALSSSMQANVINAGMPDSFQCRYNPLGDESNPYDGISLYNMVDAVTGGDYSSVLEAAAGVSQTAYDKAVQLETVDMGYVDCAVIFYDLSDYIDHRNIYNPGDENDVTTFCGALNASIKLLQERCPHVRIVVMSTPACGKTIDDYYVDGTMIDLANGTLSDYIGNEVGVCASNGVSFIDLYFGAIHVDNRDKYLVNDYHLNKEGAEVVAQRFAKLIVL